MWSIIVGAFIAKACQDINCLSCDNISGIEKCLSCSDSLFPLDGSCVECEIQPLSCSLTPSGTWDCACASTKSSNLFLQAPGLTFHCSGWGSCLVCKNGFYLDEWNSCEICSESCNSCIDFNTCLDCKSSFKEVAGLCCPLGCSDCDTEKCLACEYGFRLEKNGVCFEDRTTDCIDGCHRCTDFFICEECYDGFYLSEGLCLHCVDESLLECGRILQSCPQDCAYCTKGNCHRCLPGYYLSDNKCLQCGENCVLCDSQNVCSICPNGRSKINGSCCDPKCDNCVANKCYSCQAGFQLVDGRCAECPKDCSSCKSGKCIQLSCPANCLNCNEKGKCLRCSSLCYLSKDTCFDCPEGCLACDNEKLCTKCPKGKYLKNGSCCGDFCTSCSGNQCFKCEEDYLLKDNNCVACPSTCKGCKEGACLNGSCPKYCQTCSSKTSCTACISGYYLDTSNCFQCNPRCKDCNSKDLCLSCFETQVFSNGYCCEPNCISCTHEKCWACLDGFLLQGIQCLPCPSECSNCKNGKCQKIKCPDSCKECDNEGNCLRCIPGFFLDRSGNCGPCGERCEICDYPTICKICKPNYTLINGYCCDDGCSICDENVCWKCQAGYELVQGKPQKIKCCDHCDVCYSNSICTSCEKGYYTTKEGICAKYPCYNQCVDCDSKKCIKCDNYYELVDGSCQKIKCYDECLDCISKDFCYVCQEGYYAENGLCQKIRCSDNCDSCKSSDYCVQCKSGYYLNTKNACVICSKNCNECNQYGCTLCSSGYTSINGFCCTKYTTKCNEIESLSCQTGYLLSSGKCVDCPSSCTSCSNSQCIVTVACPSNCISCGKDGKCSVCTIGYFVESDACTKCLSQCLSCISIKKCTACNFGYTLKSDFCCPSQCKTCDEKKCLTCEVGYIYDGTSCNPCPATCSSCSDGKCISSKNCGKKCLSCYSSTNCTVCETGFWLSAGSCIQCKDKCKVCDSLGKCTSCETNYRPYQEFCCPTECATCNALGCTSCYPQYFLSSGRCK